MSRVYSVNLGFAAGAGSGSGALIGASGQGLTIVVRELTIECEGGSGEGSARFFDTSRGLVAMMPLGWLPSTNPGGRMGLRYVMSPFGELTVGIDFSAGADITWVATATGYQLQ